MGAGGGQLEREALWAKGQSCSHRVPYVSESECVFFPLSPSLRYPILPSSP